MPETHAEVCAGYAALAQRIAATTDVSVLVVLGAELLALGEQEKELQKDEAAQIFALVESQAVPSLFDPAPTNKHTTHPAETYLRALFDPEDILCLTFISATDKFQHSGAPLVRNVFISMRNAVSPAALKRWVARSATENVFVSMATFKSGSKQRTKENIAVNRHVWIEIDDDADAALAAVRAAVDAGELPAPTVVVRSSCSPRNKFQIVWNLQETGSIEEVETVTRNMCARFKADPASVDAGRVLRLPGYANLKYPERPIVTLMEVNSNAEGI